MSTIQDRARAATAVRVGRRDWRDKRLWWGIALVVASVFVGARAMAASDDGVAVWSLTRALPAGTVLGADDVRPVTVALPAETVEGYAAVAGGPATDPRGRTLAHDVSDGQLLALGALVSGAQSAPVRRQVTVPVEALHAPPALARGDRVDVYVTAAQSTAATAPVLQGAVVAEVADDRSALGAATEIGVVLDIATDQAPALVAALRGGSVDLVRVPGSA